MIAKHIPIKVARKSSFVELLNYITDTQGKRERVGTIHITNCHSTQAPWAAREISATQAQNTRAESDKTYHLLLSFAPGEVVAPGVLRDIEARVCAALGYAEHQRVSAVHHDTDALHIHVAINKIHPDRLTLHQPYRDYKTLAEISAKLEIEHGLQLVNHTARRRGGHSRADDSEHAGGIESLLGWIQRECLEHIRGAQSWKELHQIMHASGLELRERANGLVITDRAGTMVKASSVARVLSKAQLEARFGRFEPSLERQAPPAREYEGRPMPARVDTTALYAAYMADQETKTVSRGLEWARVRDQKNRLIEAAKRSGRLKRAAVKLMGRGAWNKKVLYRLTSRTLRTELQKIHQQHRKDRQGIYEQYRRRAWRDWLQDQATAGDGEALTALRARQAGQGIKGDALAGRVVQAAGRIPGVEADSITKAGTMIYRVGASAIRDDGVRLQISRDVTQHGLEAALRMAMHRYGERVTVSGSAQFKEQIARVAAAAKLAITFDDVALDSRRQALCNTPTMQEGHHDRPDHRRKDRRRVVGGTRSTASASGASGTAAGGGGRAKPDIGRSGAVPPPFARGGLRDLSQLGVVRFAERSPVLLPRDVPRHMEHQAAESDNALRRAVSRSARLRPAQAVANKFIAEDQTKRLSGLDLKHKRIPDGDPVTVAAKGATKRRGRSR